MATTKRGMRIVLPQVFIIDHQERGLLTPNYRQVGRSFVCRPDDKAMVELIDDAKYYAHRWGPDGAPHIKMAATLLLKALKRQGVIK